MEVYLANPILLTQAPDGVALHQMVAERSLTDGISRTQARWRFLSELGEELVQTTDCEGWHFIAIVVRWSTDYTEDGYAELLGQAEHDARFEDIEYSRRFPDAVSDYAVPAARKADIEMISDQLQVQAATEEDAEMAMLAMLLDSSTCLVLQPDEICRIYPYDPRPNVAMLHDIWAEFVDEYCNYDYVEERLRDIEVRNFDWELDF